MKIKLRGPALAIFAGALFIWSLAELVVKLGLEESSTAAHSAIPPVEKADAMLRSIHIALAASIFQLLCLVTAIVGPLVYLLVERDKRRP